MNRMSFNAQSFPFHTTRHWVFSQFGTGGRRGKRASERMRSMIRRLGKLKSLFILSRSTTNVILGGEKMGNKTGTQREEDGCQSRNVRLELVTVAV